ncbi:MAG: Transposase [Glomeribacter sp. 1016415]|nr:Transposase [Glomeribacter sp. 1016415]
MRYSHEMSPAIELPLQTPLSELKKYISELETRAERDAHLILELQKRIGLLEEQFRLSLLKRFAPSSEKYGVQGCLFNEAEQTEPESIEEREELDDVSNERILGKKRGRKKLPEHLPRIRIEHDLLESEKTCSCCHGQLHRMGEEVTEQLNIVPAKVQVLQHVRYKYGCRYCEQQADTCQLLTSPMPAQLIPGSIASASTVATILTAKYADGLPLYRMESVFERSGIHLDRGTMARWVIRVGEEWLSRLYELMQQTLRQQEVIHGDETSVQVLKEKGRSAQSTSYMWVYRSAENCPQPVVLFEYQPGRSHEHPERFLQSFTGALMSDGYAAWRVLKGITHLGCMAHLRRRFHDALKAQKNPGGRAKQALEFIAKLYQIEKLARSEPPDEKSANEYTYELRQTKSRPIMEAFYAWLVKNNPQVLPNSLIGKAISYGVKQWQYLVRYLDDGRAPIDNNVLERDIRPFTIGRKNWIFNVCDS